MPTCASPSLHLAFGIGNADGVSNLLSGEPDIAAVLRATKWEGLSIIPAGPHPPSSADLLMGEGLHQLVARLLADFDHVIVDSPPVLGLADAAAGGGGGRCRGLRGRGRGDAGRRRQGAIERLREARANVLGAIVTKFDAGRQAFALRLRLWLRQRAQRRKTA